MAEFDDDQMKETFGKLHDYESPSAGISWSSVERRLPTNALKVGGKAFLALLIPASMIVWLSVDDPTMLADAVNVVKHPTTVSPQGSSPQQPAVQNALIPSSPTQVVSSHIVGQNSNPATQKQEPLAPTESLPSNVEVTLVAVPVAVQSFPETESPIVEEATPQLPGLTINPIDSSATTIAPDTRQSRRPGFSLEAFYLFGIVDPLKGDNRIVQDYISKPGFGVSGSINIPVRLRQGSSLYIVPSVNVFYKPYDFEVVEYEDEHTSVQHKVGESLASYAGLGVMWNLGNWQAGAAIHLGAGKEDILFARSLLSLSLNKDLFHMKRMVLTAGGSFMLPVSGSGEYLKYTPITVGIGIRKQ